MHNATNGCNLSPQDADLTVNELLGLGQLHLQDYNELLVLIQEQQARSIDFDAKGLVDFTNKIDKRVGEIAANRLVLHKICNRLIGFCGTKNPKISQIAKKLPKKYQSTLEVLIEAIDQKIEECVKELDANRQLFKRNIGYLEGLVE